MLFGIDESFESALTGPEIQAWLARLEQQQTGFWVLKSSAYEVERRADAFSVRKRSAGRNGPAHPLIRGRLMDGAPTRVAVTITPAYFVLAFCLLFPCILIPALWLSDEMNINGVKRAPELLERVFFSVFVLVLPAFIGYFNVVRPVGAAKKWLIQELRLRPAN